MKKIGQAARRSWFLWIGGLCFLVGSLVAGSYSLASAGPAVSGTVTADQGAAGRSSWNVTASQGSGTGSSGAWKVDGSGVTQPVSGTVGLNPGSSVGVSGSLPAGTNNIGNVGVSGALPAGTNNIGTVNVATPTPLTGHVACTVADGTRSCDSGDPGLAAGTVINTMSAECSTKAGQHVEVAWTLVPSSS